MREILLSFHVISAIISLLSLSWFVFIEYRLKETLLFTSVSHCITLISGISMLFVGSGVLAVCKPLIIYTFLAGSMIALSRFIKRFRKTGCPYLDSLA